jgi:hypothetical protein
MLKSKGGKRMEWYGAAHKVAEGKHLRLKEIKLNFHSDDVYGYGDRCNTYHYFEGEVRVDAIHKDSHTAFKPFGETHHTPATTELTIAVNTLPRELLDELKAVWMKVEKAMWEGGIK